MKLICQFQTNSIFFLNIGNLGSNITTNRLYQNKQEIILVFYFLTTKKEHNTFKKLNNKKSPGLDSMKTETLNIIVGQINHAFACIINKAFELGHFPSASIKYVVTSIYKNGDKQNVTKYRSISIK